MEKSQRIKQASVRQVVSVNLRADGKSLVANEAGGFVQGSSSTTLTTCFNCGSWNGTGDNCC